MADGAKKPAIQVLAHGPYLAKDVESFKTSTGEEIPVKPQMALCRCGQSSNKPFCDGTHLKVGFVDDKKDDRTLVKVDVYEGKNITVFDNRGVCSHRGYCSTEVPSVWRSGVEPWIDPDGASVEEIIRICEKCPSGALSYALPGGERRRSVEGREPGIKIAERHFEHDGGYDVSGKIALETESGEQPESPEHFVLCRCGGSKNKPFCDGQHWYVKFLDEGK